jgi:membrane associated rhomboid family serine protease
VYEHVLLISTVLSGMRLLGLVRRAETGQRGYQLVLAVVVGLGILALVRDDRFVGSIAIALGTLTVVFPWLLEVGSRWAFTRGRLSLAVRAAGLRGLLMPGSGLGRQQQLLDGIGLLEREGVDAALEHFRSLANDTEDGGELALIHEQIVSMLFYGQRWDEGIAHYERRFHPGYAAVRPGLALGLLRAYGESGRLDHAAGLLRALEEGPVGADPRSAEMLGQARVTFLAYAGAAGAIAEVVNADRTRDLGISPASAALFHGIALARAGEVDQARTALRSVEVLAGPRDRNVLEASRAKLDSIGEAALDIGPELRAYAGAVAQRLRGFLRARAPYRPRGPLAATWLVMLGLAVVHGIVLWRDAGGIGLLELGAARVDLVQAGGWPRLLTAPWLHADAVTLLFDVYAIWLAGQLVEHAHGWARTLIIALGGAIAGLLAAFFLTPYPTTFVAGNLTAVACIVAALWTLLPARTPGLSPRGRRALAITLGLLFAANLLASLPALLGLDYPPIAFIGAAAFATALTVGLPTALPRAVERVLSLAGGALLAVTIVSFGWVGREDPEAFLAQTTPLRCELSGVELRVPATFEWTAAEDVAGLDLPVLDGLTDLLELRAGGFVQIAVVPGAPPAEGSSLLQGRPELARSLSATGAHELPAGWSAAPSETWRGFHLRRGGEIVGAAVEREVAGAGVVIVVGSPPEVLSHAPQLWAGLLAAARPATAAGPDQCRLDAP